MSFVPELDGAVLAAARAVGLLDASGALDTNWFGDPMHRVQRILTDPDQREAALELLGLALPAQPMGQGERWHALGSRPAGDVFLTTNVGDKGLQVGLAARAHGGGTEGDPLAALEVRLPLLHIDDGSLTAIAGTDSGAVRVGLRIRLDWADLPDAVTARAIRVEAVLTPRGDGAQGSLGVVIEGVDLGDGLGPSDRVLDPRALGGDAVHVLVGLVRRRLQASTLGGAAARVAAHALPLLGFDPALPALPLDELVADPTAPRRWLQAMLAGDGSAFATWLGHLSGLLGGASVPAGTVTGTEQDPWRIRLTALAAGSSSLDVLGYVTRAADGSRRIHLALEVALVPEGPEPALRAAGRALLASIPLEGTEPLVVLDSASLLVEAPGDSAATLVDAAGITVRSLRAGIVYTRQRGIVPVLELGDVEHGGARYPTLDLSSADAVVDAAGTLVRQAILDALGSSPKARALAALAGLVAPSSDPAWPHEIDLGALASDPARAIGNVHLAALGDPAHGWDKLLAEAAGLAGLDPATLGGAGTEDDPWRLAIDAVGPVSLQLVAWDERPAGAPPTDHRLRAGVRAVVATEPWNVVWRACLIAWDAAGSDRNLSLLGSQQLAARLDPIPDVPELGGVALSAEALALRLEWAGGRSVSARAAVLGLTVGSGSEAVTIPELAFPSPPGVDPAALFGVASDVLQHLLQKLLLRAAFDWAGTPGLIVGALFGGHGALPGLPADWPTFASAAATDALEDPLGALRAWLGRVATETGSGGQRFAPLLVNWLGVLLSQSIHGAPEGSSDDDDEPVEPSAAPRAWVRGTGHPDDPWAVPVAPGAAAGVELLAWLGPSGTSGTDPALLGRVDAATGFGTLLQAVDPVANQDPLLREILSAVGRAWIVDRMNDLEAALRGGDGVVPLSAQVPTHAAWTAGTTVASPHHLLPADPSVIAQVLARVDALAPTDRVVILLGPEFADRSAWSLLLSEAEAARANSTDDGAVFALRGAGAVAPSAVTAVADFYVAELGGATHPALLAELDAVVERVAALRPGVRPILVAHSTGGLVARAFARSAPARVAGIVTIGTPHGHAALHPFTDPAVSEAARMVARLVPGDFGSDAVGHVIDHWLQALDARIAYTPALFATDPELDVGGVPALAIGSRIDQSLLEWLRPRVRQRVVELMQLANAVPLPTHVAFGFRTRLATPVPAAGMSRADVTLRVDAGRLPFAEINGEPRRLPVSLRARLHRPAGWLTGGASAASAGTIEARTRRLQWAELGVDWNAETGASAIEVRPVVRLYDVAHGQATSVRVEFGEAALEPALGATLRALSTELRDTGSPLGSVFAALQALEIAAVDALGDVGISADAFAALATDPAGFLAPRLRAALARPEGLLGLRGLPQGPWTLDAGDGRLQLTIQPDPWRIGIATPATPIALAPGASLGGSVVVSLPDGLSGSFRAAAEATLQMGSARLAWSSASGKLVLDAPPFLGAVTLVPVPPRAEAASLVRDLLPGLLLSAAASALLRTTLGDSFSVGPIQGLLASPGRTLSAPNALGASGGGLSAERIHALLVAVGTAAGFPAANGLLLPGGLLLQATGTGPVRLGVSTTAPLGGVLSFDLGFEVDASLAVTPRGALTVAVDLPGTWPSLEVRFALEHGELSLAVAPAGVPAIQLLPHFSGLGTLAGGASALLPAVLDAVVDALGPPATRSAIASRALEVAEALELYDEANGFAGHTDRLRAFAGEGGLFALSAEVQTAAAMAFASLFTGSGLAAALPGSFGVDGRQLVWKLDLGAGRIELRAGWSAGRPAITLAIEELQLADAPARLDARAAVSADDASCRAVIALPLADSVGIDATPLVALEASASTFQLSFVPLGTGTESDLLVVLAPSMEVRTGPSGPLALVRTWLLPLAARFALEAAGSRLDAVLWTGGPTTRALLEDAGLIQSTAAGPVVQLPLPDAQALLARLLRAAAAAAEPGIEITPTLRVVLVDDEGTLGVRLRGHVDASAGALTISPLFGEPPVLVGDSDRGLGVSLLHINDDDSVSFAPAIHIVGVGARLSRTDGTALVPLDAVRIHAVAATAFLEIDLDGAAGVSGLGAGIDLEGVGVPLGQASQAGGNPVAASLLGSSLAEAGKGDAASPAPAVDVVLVYRDGQLRFEIGGGTQPLWIDIQRGFGPVYIERIGVRSTPVPAVVVAVDGSVTVDGLALSFDELGLDIPLASLATPSDWSLDLAGLSTSFDRSGVSVRGALRKSVGPPLEYRGLLSVQVASRTFTAMGAYARPVDAQGSYASLFAFVALPIPLGGPPFFFVTGLGAGFGYNRSLVTPAEPEDVETFPLLVAIDDTSALDDPMAMLRDMGAAFPPKRGALWAAAGVRFSTFERLKTRAVVYASLDRDLEIGLLGISRTTLPKEEAPLLHIELALLARYSGAENRLAAEAALTDSSWLLHRDCRLTGGFAFSIWFSTGQFVLTLGGYAPAFSPPPEFPSVDRLGFEWQVSDRVVVKGGCYFALTNSCVMAGGFLEADYRKGGIHAWFDTDLDILVSWDPLHYDFSFSIDVGASFTKRICFIKCVTLHVDVSIGATLHIAGPPLHGEATVDLAVASVTIAFGSEPQRISYIEEWSEFAAKYLQDEVSLQATAGLRPASPPDAGPWTADGEFEVTVESKMPADTFGDFTRSGWAPVAGAAHIDLAPMGRTWAGANGVRSRHVVSLERRDPSGWTPVTSTPDHFLIEPIIGHVPEATWRFIAPDDLEASANTLPALTGLRVRAVASFEGRTETINVAHLADAGPTSLPLPLRRPGGTHLEQLGAVAEVLSADIASRPAPAHEAAIAGILSGDVGAFAAARAQSGLAVAGMSPLGARALQRQRSAPPRIVPIAGDLAMRAAGLPPAIERPAAPAPKPSRLDAPRLRSVIRTPMARPQRPRLGIRTSVSAPRVPRVSPPAVPEVLGAKLFRAPAPQAVPVTTPPATGRVFQNPERTARRRAGDAALQQNKPLTEGAAVASGSVHVWELPLGRARSLRLDGKSAVRVTQMGAAGELVADVESVGTDAPVVIEEGTVLLAVTALAASGSGKLRGPGAVSAALAPGASLVATGWQSTDHLVSVGERTLLARGATVLLPLSLHTAPEGRRTGRVLRAAEAIAGQPAVETRLPGSTQVVLVFLDVRDACGAEAGDVAIAVSGGELGAPLSVVAGRKLCVVYPVAKASEGALHVSVGSRAGFELAGVVGVHGRADEWVARLRKGIPTRLVPELAIDDGGQARARLELGDVR